MVLVSVPDPPSRKSLPLIPSREISESLPFPVEVVGTTTCHLIPPPSPRRTPSSPPMPSMVSLPAMPQMVSAPKVPSRTSLPEVPVIVQALNVAV